MAKVIWAKEDREDLEGIYLYLFGFSEKSAKAWASEITQTAFLLENFPRMGRVVPNINININRLRECVVKQHRLIYEVNEDDSLIEIMAIRHSSKPLSDF